MQQPEWVVKKVTPNKDYTLVVEFHDGNVKKIDMKPVIAEGGVFEPLNNIAFFMLAKTDGCTVIWNDKIDIAPEYLYEHGEPLN